MREDPMLAYVLHHTYDVLVREFMDSAWFSSRRDNGESPEE
jgi:hypothetical protein